MEESGVQIVEDIDKLCLNITFEIHNWIMLQPYTTKILKKQQGHDLDNIISNFFDRHGDL